MDKTSELECYIFYMYNVWNMDECIALFGEHLGNHIWNKWTYYCDLCTSVGAASAIYPKLDADKRRRIVERAVEHYNR